ncbi:NAD(P)-binding domain-containing protein [Actinomadura sp. DC4]|uniref:NAD(P)-dependent oxidoreductase n=1 Tax=Actinomadura sp. DC4 TaxID=3055069 RepID=UPI0025B1B9D1|nr:NAD(P)-binding domain-containing protein [Actinomadura sp. DC4]MDN3351852.1 NAD(P)-binding domain-containing protein [Actinomadura sp. DC4]
MTQRAEAPVTVIGLGPMGRALAGAFVEAGHPTTVWNRTAARADDLVARGAVRAATAAAAVAASPLVVACLLDDDAVQAVLGPADLRGRTLVNLTSSAPGQARRRAEWAREQGAGYLDGAILTPTPTIGRSSALVLYSGPEDLYRAHRPILDGLGGTATYLGEDPGRAAAFDVTLLDVFWTSVSGLVHGLALARAEGISGDVIAPYAALVFALLPEMATRFARRLDDGDHPGERSTVASAAAGLEHVVATARAHGMDTGVLEASHAVVRRAVDAGHGADGLSRLAAVLAP